MGGLSNLLADVSAAFHLKVMPEADDTNNIPYIGCVRALGENDPGLSVQPAMLMSNEIDLDYRSRSSSDTMLDDEQFNYAAQNTGKHSSVATTMVPAWTANAYQSNSTGITTINTGVTFGTYAPFSIIGTHTLALDVEVSFSAGPVPTNTTIDFGFFPRASSVPFAPTDGVYIRATNGGLRGVCNFNGVETTTPYFLVPAANPQTVPTVVWQPAANQNYQFIIYITPRVTQFWINQGGTVFLAGSLQVPAGNGMPCQSNALPFSIRHAIGGIASSACSFNVSHYSVRSGGAQNADTLGTTSNRISGSYQGLSGGTMGGLTKYTNSTNPTAAIPSNTVLTANLPSGLGGEAWITASYAVNTDVILMDYTVPAFAVGATVKRLRVTGLKMSGYVQAVLTGGPCNQQIAVAYGHTAVSLATAEGAATKKPRILLCPELLETITAAQAVNTVIARQSNVSIFPDPIYVNPGEHIAVVLKQVGTNLTVGTIAENMQFIYSWE
jgi:hypothetical protein